VVKKASGGTRAEIGLLIDPAHTLTGEASIISDNTIESRFIAVYSNPASPLYKSVIVSANVIDADGVSTAGGEAGILLKNASGSIITGNVVYS
jgi:hypothetical protein